MSEEKSELPVEESQALSELRYGSWEELSNAVRVQGEALEAMRKESKEMQEKIELLLRLKVEKPSGRDRKD